MLKSQIHRLKMKMFIVLLQKEFHSLLKDLSIGVEENFSLHLKVISNSPKSF